MKPEETGSRYDRIALRWQQQHMGSTYDIAALQRAIRFVENKSTALDIGCESSGRFIEELPKNGFTSTGVDISPRLDYPRHFRRLKNDNSSRTNG